MAFTADEIANINNAALDDFIDKGKLGVETREGFYHYDEQGNATGLTDAAKAAYPDFEG